MMKLYKVEISLNIKGDKVYRCRSLNIVAKHFNDALHKAVDDLQDNEEVFDIQHVCDIDVE